MTLATPPTELAPPPEIAARLSWFHRRVRGPLRALMLSGATPERLALSLVLGLVIGVFPMIGATTALCAAVAILLRLNLPAIQLVNYLAYPIHIALLIPFVRLGEWLYRAPPIPLSIEILTAAFKADLGGTIARLWRTELQAITAWAIVAPVATALLYYALMPVLRNVMRRRRIAAEVG